MQTSRASNTELSGLFFDLFCRLEMKDFIRFN